MVKLSILPEPQAHLLSSPASHHRLDVGIVGGGIAGLWLLNLLSRRGYSAVLFEREALGCDQTLASQGMIHGGLKYALTGHLTGASEAIAAMPSRWRACLAGDDEVDLQGVPLLSDNYFLFAGTGARNKLAGFLASRALRGRVDRLERSAWPAAFEGFDGRVYALNEFVVDTASLIRVLSEPWRDRIVQHRVSGNDTRQTEHGYRLSSPAGEILVTTLINCAGNGSQQLQSELGIEDLPTQQRPVKQVIVHPRHRTALHAHCITGIASDEPRITITSRDDGDGVVWYLGGHLATTGVDRSDDDQLAFAQRELAQCVPWLDWEGARWEVLWVDRAEPATTFGLRPDEASVRSQGNYIQCFPTKLTLAPDLGDKVLNVLPAPSGSAQPTFATAHPVPVGTTRW